MCVGGGPAHGAAGRRAHRVGCSLLHWGGSGGWLGRGVGFGRHCARGTRELIRTYYTEGRGAFGTGSMANQLVTQVARTDGDYQPPPAQPALGSRRALGSPIDGGKRPLTEMPNRAAAEARAQAVGRTSGRASSRQSSAAFRRRRDRPHRAAAGVVVGRRRGGPPQWHRRRGSGARSTPTRGTACSPPSAPSTWGGSASCWIWTRLLCTPPSRCGALWGGARGVRSPPGAEQPVPNADYVVPIEIDGMVRGGGGGRSARRRGRALCEAAAHGRGRRTMCTC